MWQAETSQNWVSKWPQTTKLAVIEAERGDRKEAAWGRAARLLSVDCSNAPCSTDGYQWSWLNHFWTRRWYNLDSSAVSYGSSPGRRDPLWYAEIWELSYEQDAHLYFLCLCGNLMFSHHRWRRNALKLEAYRQNTRFMQCIYIISTVYERQRNE